tara:strand:+ start:464 stop:1240 length:777 start_codon:yes stop_codon:yes gene_type:complete
MLRKRLIFTLLYDSGYFIQSRNFRRQKIGKKEWINKNYNFSYVSNFIDELIILDISDKKNIKKFMQNCKYISDKVFVPMSFGGGINTIEYAKQYFKNGADKVVINSQAFLNKKIINKISDNYGSSSVIISIDVKYKKKDHYVYIHNGQQNTEMTIERYLNFISDIKFAEVYVNSIDNDGTGNGIDKKLLLKLKRFDYKFIITGGLGNFTHFYEVFKKNKKVEAIATANLLNFVGDSLKIVRERLIKKKVDLSIRNLTV